MLGYHKFVMIELLLKVISYAANFAEIGSKIVVILSFMAGVIAWYKKNALSWFILANN
jgi:uncharacterized membrane protein